MSNELHWKLLEYASTLPRPEKNPDLFGLNGVYLRRWIVQSFPEECSQLRLHHIVRADEDLELHDHPWGDRRRKFDAGGNFLGTNLEARTSRSLILFGGYEEERRRGSSLHWIIQRFRYRPGDVNVLYSDDFHRIDRLFNPLGAWSLFWTGPTTQSWQFWNRLTNIYTPWRDFIEEKKRAQGGTP